MKQQDWTQQLYERVGDYEAAVPDGLWADIEQSLPQQQATAVPLWHRWIAVAGLATLLVGTGWWLWPRQEQTTKPRLTAQDNHQQEYVNAVPTKEVDNDSRRSERVVPSPTLSMNQPNASETADSTVTQETPAATSVTPESAVASADTTKAVARPSQPTRHSYPTLPTVTKSQSIAVGLYANSGLLALYPSGGNDRANYLYASQPQNDYTTNTPVLQRQLEAEHDRPFTLGLTVGYPLSPRWMVSTGVVYNRLHSTFTNHSTIYRDQTLHYVGIPLNVQYNAATGRRWKVYVTAGAEADWNIKGEQRDRLQWSAGGAIGAEYDVLPRLGVYVEPGLRYYPDNGSATENYFKAHPTLWSLQFGLRLNLNVAPKE